MNISPIENLRAFEIKVQSLDPIRVFLIDYSLGSGRIIVECYGESWSAYFGAMKESTITQFTAECGKDYLVAKFATRTMAKDYLGKIVSAVKDGCREIVNAEVVA